MKYFHRPHILHLFLFPTLSLVKVIVVVLARKEISLASLSGKILKDPYRFEYIVAVQGRWSCEAVSTSVMICSLRAYEHQF